MHLGTYSAPRLSVLIIIIIPIKFCMIKPGIAHLQSPAAAAVWREVFSAILKMKTDIM